MTARRPTKPWPLDDIREAAEHLYDCLNPPDCPGRYPDYNTCSVADLAQQYLDLQKKYIDVVSGESQSLLRAERDAFAIQNAAFEDAIQTLYGAIKHGDQAHRDWLFNTIGKHFEKKGKK